jgi:type VI protein secretion system component Hcp
MPTQTLGQKWHLAGTLKRVKTSSHEVTLVRRTDTLSPHMLAAKTSQYVIPTVIVTTPSGQTIELQNARIVAIKDTMSQEEIDFVFQKIVTTNPEGKTSATDDWESQT